MVTLINPFWSAGGGSGLTLSFVASAVTGGSTFTIPASAQAGDVAILFDRVSNTTTPTSVVPSGYTQIANNVQATERGIVSYKKLEAGDPGSTPTGMNGDTFNSKIATVFRPSSAISTVTVGSVNGQATGDNPSQQTVTVASVQTPLIVFGHYAGEIGKSYTGITFSPTHDAQIQGNLDANRARYKIYNESPSDTTVDLGDTGSPANILQSFYLRVS